MNNAERPGFQGISPTQIFVFGAIVAVALRNEGAVLADAPPKATSFGTRMIR